MGKAEELRLDCRVRARVKTWTVVVSQLGVFSMSHGKKVATLDFKSKFP